MTLKEAAALLGVTPDNLRQSIARGTFKAKKLGRDWFTTQAEVTRYMAENRRPGRCWECGRSLVGVVSQSHGRMPGERSE